MREIVDNKMDYQTENELLQAECERLKAELQEAKAELKDRKEQLEDCESKITALNLELKAANALLEDCQKNHVRRPNPPTKGEDRSCAPERPLTGDDFVKAPPPNSK